MLSRIDERHHWIMRKQSQYAPKYLRRVNGKFLLPFCTLFSYDVLITYAEVAFCLPLPASDRR